MQLFSQVAELHRIGVSPQKQNTESKSRNHLNTVTMSPALYSICRGKTNLCYVCVRHKTCSKRQMLSLLYKCALRNRTQRLWELILSVLLYSSAFLPALTWFSCLIQFPQSSDAICLQCASCVHGCIPQMCSRMLVSILLKPDLRRII